MIPALEKSGLIHPVGLWVLEKALNQCREWRKIVPNFRISVNMACCQLDKASVKTDVLDILKCSGVPGEALTIEITESSILYDYPHFNKIFHKWREYGIQISVDDFGTGYSSLDRLKEMNIDEIKIDRCFIKNIESSLYSYRLVNSIMELADSCQMRVCCEGVETQKELDVLEELHPDLYQGFLFAKPCSEAEFAEGYLKNPLTVLAEVTNPPASLPAENPIEPDAPLWEHAASKVILDAEDDIFFLSDLDTHELYYLNPAGQKLFGVKDYKGKKCYKVFHGLGGPCTFCREAFLSQKSFWTANKLSEYCGCYFALKSKIVFYKGKKLRLEIAVKMNRKNHLGESTIERIHLLQQVVQQFINNSYDYIYYIDLKNNLSLRFAGNADTSRIPMEEDTDYVGTMIDYADQFVVAEDREMIKRKMSPDYIVEHLQNHSVLQFQAGVIEKDGHCAQKRMEFQYYNKKDQIVILTRSDITESHRQQQKQELAVEYLQKTAMMDILTQLYNRLGYEEEIENFLLKADDESQAAFFFIDLDNFKEINDKLGHQKGDEVLQEVARLLKDSFRKTDIIGRLGGDEFVAFAKDIGSVDMIRIMADKLLTTLCLTYSTESGTIQITPSIGISLFPEHGTTLDELYQCADEAMYQVKHSQKHGYRVYEK